MTIQFNCDCGRALSVRDDLAGRRARCPGCGEVLAIPDGLPPISGGTSKSGEATAGAASGAATLVAGAEVAGRMCSICQTAIAVGESLRRCGDCGLPFHEECWLENGGCATYGCPLAPKTVKNAEQQRSSVEAWGDTKTCPLCGETIRAGALKCRYCGEFFDSSDPMTQQELMEGVKEKTVTKRNRANAIVYFVVSLTVFFLGPLTAIIGVVWATRYRDNLKRLEPIYRLLIIAGICLSILYSMLFVLVILDVL